MLRNSAGFSLPSYFSGISGLNVRTDGQRTCRNSRVKVGQPTSKGRHPPTPSAGSSTLRLLHPSVWRRSSRCRSTTTHASPQRLSSGARRWPGRARESEEAIEMSSGGWKLVLVHAHRHLLRRYAGLVRGCWKYARFSLRSLHHLADHILPSWHRARRVAPWCHAHWPNDGALGRRWWRSPVHHVARCRRLLRQ